MSLELTSGWPIAVENTQRKRADSLLDYLCSEEYDQVRGLAFSEPSRYRFSQPARESAARFRMGICAAHNPSRHGSVRGSIDREQVKEGATRVVRNAVRVGLYAEATLADGSSPSRRKRWHCRYQAVATRQGRQQLLLTRLQLQRRYPEAPRSMQRAFEMGRTLRVLIQSSSLEQFEGGLTSRTSIIVAAPSTLRWKEQGCMHQY